MNDYNFIYYSLSTIPQVVGAVIAVLGAFILAYVENQNIKLDGEGQTFWDEIVNKKYKLDKTKPFKQAKFTRRYKEMREQMRIIVGEDNNETLEESFNHFKGRLKSRNKIIHNFLILFGFASLIIVTSLVLLAFSDSIIHCWCPSLQHNAILGLIFLTAIFLGFLAFMIYKHLKEERSSES